MAGDAFGLRNFGVNLMRLPPGYASSQRHWHSRQDELVYIVAGELRDVAVAALDGMAPRRSGRTTRTKR